MKGRVCMITGASSGIGRATALELADAGATLILVCRDQSRGKSVIDEIRARDATRSADLFISDLASQASIRALADQYLTAYQQLHVLINNAGAYFTKRHVTGEGVEATFAVNYLAPFLLTNLLLDVLKNSAPARIVNVAGGYHTKGSISFDDLQGERHFSGRRAIAQSKLAEVLFTYELARRLEGTGVTANCVDPGLVGTGLIDKDEDLPIVIKYAYRLVRPFLKSPERGAETTVYAASHPEVAGSTGEYFISRRSVRSSDASYDENTARRLWDVSLAFTGLSAR